MCVRCIHTTYNACMPFWPTTLMHDNHYTMWEWWGQSEIEWNGQRKIEDGLSLTLTLYFAALHCIVVCRSFSISSAAEHAVEAAAYIWMSEYESPRVGEGKHGERKVLQNRFFGQIITTLYTCSPECNDSDSLGSSVCGYVWAASRSLPSLSCSRSVDDTWICLATDGSLIQNFPI